MVHRKRQRLLTASLLLHLLLSLSYVSVTSAKRVGTTRELKKCKGVKTPTSKGTKSPTSKGTKSPTSKGTKSPTSKGVKAPQKHKRNDCEESLPSAVPSISPHPSISPSSSPSVEPTKSSMPSTMPSKLPSQNPSVTPSRYPSASPSISQQPSLTPSQYPSLSPSTSHQPSASAEPSNAPSHQPKSPWCPTINSGEPPKTGRVVTGKFYYRMFYNTDTDTLSDILKDLDEAILKDLKNDHVWCGQDNFHGKNSRSLSLSRESPDHSVGLKINKSFDGEKRSLMIDGISLNGPDEPQAQCDSSSDSNSCQTFKGNYTLYIREDSLVSMSDEEAKTRVLRTIRDGMDPVNGTLASENNSIEKLEYLGENPPDVENRQVGSGKINDNQPRAKIGISSIGYTLITIASVVTLFFIFAATRKRNHHRIERMEEFYEEEQDLFGKGIGLDDLDDETDLMSTDSFRRNRNVHILGDGDSQYNGQLYGLGRYNSSAHGPEVTRLGQRGDALDVHKCSSATCPICTQRLANPTFVKSMFPIELNGAKPRGYAAPNTVDM